MVEFLVLVVLIVVLSGIVIIILMPSSDRSLKQTSVTLKNTRLKLEEYAADNNGIYPVGEDCSSAILYRKLSGDESAQGLRPTGPSYWAELNKANNSSLVGTVQGKKVILDGFGNVIRYQAALDENKKPVPGVKNVEDFDLWSVGPDGEPADLNTPGALKNGQTKDDIW